MGRAANTAVWATARSHLKTIVRSRAMWGATGLLFLVYLAPGFQTPMLYYQQDVLKLDPRFIGFLQLLGGVGGIIGAAAYGYLCRRLPLKVSLVAGILLNAAVTLLYLRYDSARAAALDRQLGGPARDAGHAAASTTSRRARRRPAARASVSA